MAEQGGGGHGGGGRGRGRRGQRGGGRRGGGRSEADDQFDMQEEFFNVVGVLPPESQQTAPAEESEAAVGRSKNPLVYLSNLSPRLKDREAPRVLGPIGGATLVYYARFRRLARAWSPRRARVMVGALHDLEFDGRTIAARFEEGSNQPYDGHLLTIAGLTPTGKVITFDLTETMRNEALSGCTVMPDHYFPFRGSNGNIAGYVVGFSSYDNWSTFIREWDTITTSFSHANIQHNFLAVRMVDYGDVIAPKQARRGRRRGRAQRG